MWGRTNWPQEHISVGKNQNASHPVGRLKRGKFIPADCNMAEVQEKVSIKTNKKKWSHHLFTLQSKQKQTSGEMWDGVETGLNWNPEGSVMAVLHTVVFKESSEVSRHLSSQQPTPALPHSKDPSFSLAPLTFSANADTLWALCS